MRSRLPGSRAVRLAAWAGFACLVVAVAGLGLRTREYDRYLLHDPAADVTLPFEPGSARCVKARVDARGFHWPDAGVDWHTALLELRVHTRWSGRLRDPGLAVVAGDIAVRQYFERGVRGRRFVNLSAFAARPPVPGQGLAITGTDLRWDEGPACLWLFDDPEPGGPTLVVAPHPDDGEIAAFSFYARPDTWVVTLTAGEASLKAYPSIGADPEAQRAFVGQLRAWDSLVVPFFGGVPPARALQLGYPDGRLEELWSEPARTLAADAAPRELNLSPLRLPARTALSGQSLVADLRFLLERLAPATVIAPHPLTEGHPDHRAAAFALARALDESGWRRGRLLLYTARAASDWHFPAGDDGAEVGLPPWFGQGPLGQRVRSVPLPLPQRERKRLALQAMHDLGLPPPRVDGAWALARRQAGEWYGLALRPDRSYFRRAVRPSEVFFAIDAERVPDYFASFAGSGAAR